MWIKCKEDNTPINLNIIIGLDKGINIDNDFFIQFNFKGYYSDNQNYELWYFEKESRRNEVYSKIYNLLNIQEL